MKSTWTTGNKLPRLFDPSRALHDNPEKLNSEATMAEISISIDWYAQMIKNWKKEFGNAAPRLYYENKAALIAERSSRIGNK